MLALFYFIYLPVLHVYDLLPTPAFTLEYLISTPYYLLTPWD
jgi:hypothetical protein